MSKLLEERHEGSGPAWTGGDEETWTDSVGAGCSIANKAMPDGTYGTPPGWGNYAKRLVYDTAGWDCTRKLSFAAITGVLYLSFDIVIVEENLANGELQPLVRMRDTATVPAEDVCQVDLVQDGSGNLLWRFYSMETGSTFGTTGHDGPAVALGTVYRHRIMYDFDNSRTLWYVNGVLWDESTTINPGNQIDKLNMGLASGHTNKRLRFDIDRIMVDNAAWPEYHVPHLETDRSLVVNDAEIGELIVAGAQSVDLVLGGDPDALNLVLRDQENRVIDSEDLDDLTYWDLSNVLTPTLADGPDGSAQLAWDITEDSTAADLHRLLQTDLPMERGRLFTATCWVADLSIIASGNAPRNYEIVVKQETGETYFAKFDLQTGAVNSTGATGDGEILGARVSESDGDWHRVVIWGRLPGGTATTATWIHSLLDGAFSRTFDGGSNSGVRVWNPQFSRGEPQQVRAEVTTGETAYSFGPDDRADVNYQVYFVEADGAPWGWQTMFVGKVMTVETSEVVRQDKTKLNRYDVQFGGMAREFGEERFDLIVPDGNAGDALDAVVALRSGDGFAGVYDSAIGTITGDTFAYASPVGIVEEIGRRSGRILRFHSDKRVELLVPGTKTVVPIIDRDAVTGQLPESSKPTWKRDGLKLAGSVRVQGENILAVATGGAYTDLDAPLFSASGVTDSTDLGRIAASLLASVQSPVLNGTIPTWRHDIEPGQLAIVSDLDWNVVEEEVYVQRVSMVGSESGVWLATLEVTTEALIDNLGILPPQPEDPRPGDPLPDSTFYYVYNAIPTPNASAPSCAADEVRLHLRFDSSTSMWRLELHCGSNKGGSGARWSANMFFMHQATMSVTHSTENTAASETAIRDNNATARVRVGTGNAALKHDFWEADQSDYDALTAIPSIVKGTLQIGVLVMPWAGEKLASLTIGDFTVDTDVPVAQTIRIRMAVDPSIGDAQIGTLTLDVIDDGATYGRVLLADLTAGRVDTLYKASGALSVEQFIDKTNDDLADIPGDTDDLTPTAARTFVHPTFVDGSLRPDLLYASDALGNVDAQTVRDAIDNSGNLRGTRYCYGDVRKEGVATLIDVGAQAMVAGNIEDGVTIADTTPESASYVRAGSTRAMEAIGSDYVYEGFLKEGLTGYLVGTTEYGLEFTSDGGPINADTLTGGGGGTGEGGGDPIEV